MAITTKTGTVSYSAGYSYDTITQGTQKFPYTAVYNPETNSTTITFGTCQHQFYNKGLGSVAVTLITITDLEDSFNQVQTLVFTSSSSNTNSTLTQQTGPSLSKLILQHKGTLGEKSIKISASTTIRCHPNSTAVTNNQAVQYTASGSKTVTLGAYEGAELLNQGFIGREGGLVAVKWPSEKTYLRVWAMIIPYTVAYNASNKTSVVTFGNVRIRQRGYNAKASSSSGTITVTPSDNTQGSSFLSLSHSKTTNDNFTNYYPTLSTNSLVVQHDATSTETLRYITISVDISASLYLSSASKWSITWSTATGALASGSTSDFAFGIPIDNGEELQFYQIYIDDGKAWQLADCYIDLRTQWLKSE